MSEREIKLVYAGEAGERLKARPIAGEILPTIESVIPARVLKDGERDVPKTLAEVGAVRTPRMRMTLVNGVPHIEF